MDNTTTPLTKGLVLVGSRLPVTIFGLVENIIVIYLYFRSSKLRNVSMKIILNLAVTDLITILAFNLNGIGFVFQRESQYICIGRWLVLMYMITVSQSVLWIATFERYIAICHQEHYTRIMTRRNFLSMLVSAWIIPLLLSLQSIFGSNIFVTDRQCFYPTLFKKWVYHIHSIVNIVLIVTTLGLYIEIILKAREFYLRLRPAQVAVVNEASMRIRARQRSIQSGKSIGIITAAFIICYLPFHIFQFRFGSEFHDDPHILVVLGGLGTFNSLVNPFLYAWQKQEFRSEIRKFLRCRCIQNKVDVVHLGENGMSRNNNGTMLPRQENNAIGQAISPTWHLENRARNQQIVFRNCELDVIEETQSYEETPSSYVLTRQNNTDKNNTGDTAFQSAGFDDSLPHTSHTYF